MIKGIDISVYQQNIDFEKIKKSGIEFVIIRAGFGKVANQKDKLFESHYANAKKAGLKVGCYHYTYAKNIQEAEQEAEIFLEWIKGKQFEYPIYFDIEDSSLQNLGKQVLTDIVLTWCGKVQSAGYYVGIYANPDWFTNRLDLERLKGFDKWLAHWVSVPKWKNEFGGLWQYGLTRVDGYNDDIDGDYSYRDYEKTIKSLGLNGFKNATVQPENKKTVTATVTVDGEVYKGILTKE